MKTLNTNLLKQIERDLHLIRQLARRARATDKELKEAITNYLNKHGAQVDDISWFKVVLFVKFTLNNKQHMMDL